MTLTLTSYYVLYTHPPGSFFRRELNRSTRRKSLKQGRERTDKVNLQAGIEPATTVVKARALTTWPLLGYHSASTPLALGYHSATTWPPLCYHEATTRITSILGSPTSCVQKGHLTRLLDCIFTQFIGIEILSSCFLKIKLLILHS